MLLAVNPNSLFDATVDGETLLSLATSTATKSHPNYALIDELNRQHALVATQPAATPMAPPAAVAMPPPTRPAATMSAAAAPCGYGHHYYPYRHYAGFGSPPPPHATPVSGSDPSSGGSEASRGRLDSNDSNKSSSNGSWPSPPPPPPGPRDAAWVRAAALTGRPVKKKRKSLSLNNKSEGDDEGEGEASPARQSRLFPPVRHHLPPTAAPALDDPVGLLLHFSQTATNITGGAGVGSSSSNNSSRSRSSAVNPEYGERRVRPPSGAVSTFPLHRYQPPWPWNDDRNDADDDEAPIMNIAYV
jgi:hypothetical protein